MNATIFHRSVLNIIRQVKAKFITGLSAMLVRKDGRHPIIMMRCGPVLHRVDAKAQAIVRPFEHYVFVRPTSFRPYKQVNENLRIQFQDLYEELMHDDYRNQMICNDVIHAISFPVPVKILIKLASTHQ